MKITTDPKQSYTRKVVRSNAAAILIAMVLFFVFTVITCRLSSMNTDYRHVNLAGDSEHVTYSVRKNDGTVEHYTMPYFHPISEGEQLTVIIKQLPHTETFDNAALLFTLYYSDVQVYCGDALIFSQEKSPFGFIGHVNYIIPLPSDYRTEEMRICATVRDNSAVTDINSLQLVPDVEGVYTFQSGNTVTFLIMFSILVMSGFVFCLSLVISFQKRKINGLFFISLYAMAMIIWYMGYSNLLPFADTTDEVLAYVEFVALFAAPAPLAAYMSRLLSANPWHRICQMLAVFFFADFAVMTVLTFSGCGINYLDFIEIHRPLFLFSILFYIIGLTVTQRKTDTIAGRALFIGLGIAAVLALMEGIRYYLSQMLVHRFDFLHISLAPYAIACAVMTLLMHYGNRISEDSLLKIEQENLKKLAYIDQLTGIPNRSACYRRLEELSRSGSHTFTMIFIDINFLKATNDTWGHNSGDTLIVTAAEILSRCFGGDDFVGRWGGDEFIACHMGALTEAYDLMEEAEKKADTINRDGWYPFLISLSWGCAASTDSHPIPPEEAVSLADDTMYQMKAEKHLSRNQGSFIAVRNPDYHGPRRDDSS